LIEEIPGYLRFRNDEDIGVRLLLVGDFHGMVPHKLREIASRYTLDGCLCTGDLCQVDEIRDIIFKHFGRFREGKRSIARLKDLVPIEVFLSSADSMQCVLDFLTGLKVPVYLTVGNADYTSQRMEMMPPDVRKPSLEERLTTVKNVYLLGKESFDFNGYQILGHSPLKMPDFGRNTRAEQQWRNEVEDLFSEIVNPRRAIFVTHYPPYGTLDLVQEDQ
jgi:Icc-related predicted phosphoesterase